MKLARFLFCPRFSWFELCVFIVIVAFSAGGDPTHIALLKMCGILVAMLLMRLAFAGGGESNDRTG